MTMTSVKWNLLMTLTLFSDHCWLFNVKLLVLVLIIIGIEILKMALLLLKPIGEKKPNVKLLISQLLLKYPMTNDQWPIEISNQLMTLLLLVIMYWWCVWQYCRIIVCDVLTVRHVNDIDIDNQKWANEVLILSQW